MRPTVNKGLLWMTAIESPKAALVLLVTECRRVKKFTEREALLGTEEAELVKEMKMVNYTETFVIK